VKTDKSMRETESHRKPKKVVGLVWINETNFPLKRKNAEKGGEGTPGRIGRGKSKVSRGPRSNPAFAQEVKGSGKMVTGKRAKRKRGGTVCKEKFGLGDQH